MALNVYRRKYTWFFILVVYLCLGEYWVVGHLGGLIGFSFFESERSTSFQHAFFFPFMIPSRFIRVLPRLPILGIYFVRIREHCMYKGPCPFDLHYTIEQ